MIAPGNLPLVRYVANIPAGILGLDEPVSHLCYTGPRPTLVGPK
jgi:hypothetical protein